MGHAAPRPIGHPPTTEDWRLSFVRSAYVAGHIEADDLEEQVALVLRGESPTHAEVVRRMPLFRPFQTEVIER